MFKVMMYKKQYDKAEICIGHAKYIADKYGINISFDTNIEHYLLPDDSETNEENVNIDLTNGSEGL